MSSHKKDISDACPQGSMLSGLLINLFINDIFELADFGLEIYMCADNTAILIFADADEQIINKFVFNYSN